MLYKNKQFYAFTFVVAAFDKFKGSDTGLFSLKGTSDDSVFNEKGDTPGGCGCRSDEPAKGKDKAGWEDRKGTGDENAIVGDEGLKMLGEE